MDDKQRKNLQEVKNIREKYVPGTNRTEDKMTTLKKLDESAENPGKIVALIVGIISTLVLGLGMCCTIIWAEHYFAVGIVIGIIGLCGIAAAYPLYAKITKKQREKISAQVLRLADEIIENAE